jgi:hypothetical protein
VPDYKFADLIQGRWVRLLQSAKFVPESSNDGGVLRGELPLHAGSSMEVYVNMNLHYGFSITIKPSEEPKS